MNTVPYVFVSRDVVSLGYVDDLMLFTADKNSIVHLYQKIGKQIQMKDRNRLAQLFRSDIR